MLNLKVKCTNNSQYQYHFYSYYLRVKIGEDYYSYDPMSPSGNYQEVEAYSFKNLEYNYKLPADIKTFKLMIFDQNDEMGAVVFTLK